MLNDAHTRRTGKEMRQLFFGKNFLIKIGFDALLLVVIWLLLVLVLPRNALFYHISARQTTTARLIFTMVTSAIFICFFRLLFRNYGKPWSYMKPFDLLAIFISDGVGGIIYFFLYERFISSKYPFLLFVAIFGINCICTLFTRLLYAGIVDSLDITDA